MYLTHVHVAVNFFVVKIRPFTVFVNVVFNPMAYLYTLSYTHFIQFLLVMNRKGAELKALSDTN